MNSYKVHLFTQPFQRASKTPHRSQLQDDTDRGDTSDALSSSSSDGDGELILPQDFPTARIRRKHPSMTPSRQTQPPRNAKQQHLAVLNAILHKSVLDGDFVRAGRAFSMLIRFELHGKGVDLRRGGLWGVGGEILLRRDGGMAMGADPGPVNVDGEGTGMRQVEAFPYTEQGLANARRLYERLALQYPYRRRRPDALDERKFWPIIYSLEIYGLQARIDRAKANIVPASTPLRSTDNSENNTVPLANVVVIEDGQTEMANDDAVAEYLPEIERLANEVGERIRILPFDRDEALLKMYGDLWSWLADLSLEERPELRERSKGAHEKARMLETRRGRVGLV